MNLSWRFLWRFGTIGSTTLAKQPMRPPATMKHAFIVVEAILGDAYVGLAGALVGG
jgi:hypothetical protein